MIKKILLTIVITCFAFVAYAQTEEEVIVTGSYIKGSPTDGSSPVEIINRDLIDGIGAFDAADITANISVNSGSENQADSFTSGATQGRTNINLRGLGLTSTLVLFDGRRQTLAGSAANDGSVFVDTSAVPTILLDRVEVLKEGAASVYGSDAIAGVVNYIFRRDFKGFEVDAAYAETELGSSEDRKISFIYGGDVAGTDTNFVVAYSRLLRSPLSQSELELAPFGVSGFGNSFILSAATTVASGPYQGTYAAGENVPDANCVANRGIIVAQTSGSRCGFKYGDRFNIVNDESKEHFYASLKGTLSNDIDWSFDYLNSKTKVFDNPQSPSYPALSYAGTTIAAGNAGNPFGVAFTWVGRPFFSASYPSPLAPRSVDMDRLSFGLEGSFNNGFDWDFRVTHSGENSYGSQPDTGTSKLAAAILGTGGSLGNETFDIFVKSNNSATLSDWLRSDQETWAYNDLTVADFVMTGEVGNFAIAAGFQARSESLDVDRSVNSRVVFDAAGNLSVPADMIFLGGGVETDASRNANAFFIEASTDLTDRIELKGAVRYEDLESESTTDPKISVRFQATDDLVLRASASSSFREASLAQTYASSVGLQGVQDWQINTAGATVPQNQAAFIRVAQNGSTTLLPEEADNLNVGLIWSPTDNFQAKLDYWAVDYSNVITIQNANALARANPEASYMQRATPGDHNSTLVGVTTKYFNAASVDTNGMDLELTYAMDTNAGELILGLNASHMMQYEIPVSGVTTDVVGKFNHDNFARSLPETKAVLSANLSDGTNTFAAFGRFISSYETTRALSAAATAAGFDQNIDSHFTVDVQYSRLIDASDLGDLRVTAGLKNAFDEEVPQAWDGVNWSYDPKHHDPRGRIFTLGLKLSM